MSQSLSRRSFLKCAGSGAVSLAAALLTGVSAAAAQPRVMGQPALLDGKAAVELLGYAPAPGLGGVLVYLSVENLTARTLPVGAKLPPQPGCLDPEGALQSGQRRDRPLRGRERPLRQLCGTALRGERRRCLGLYAQPRRRAGRDAPLLLRCPGGLGGAGAELSPLPLPPGQPVEFVVRRDADAVRLGPVPATPAEVGSVVDL